MRTRPGCCLPLPHASCTAWEPAALWAGGRPADAGEQQRSRSEAPLGPGPPALPEREIRGGEAGSALSALCLPVTNGTDSSSSLAAPPWLPPPHHGKAVGFVCVRTPPRPSLLSTAVRAATCVRTQAHRHLPLRLLPLREGWPPSGRRCGGHLSVSKHRRLERRGRAGRAPFFLAVSSGSRFLVTVTTLSTRWFPPWRIMFTTCRWPTLTTFSLFTCGKTGAVGLEPRGLKGTAPTPGRQ